MTIDNKALKDVATLAKLNIADENLNSLADNMNSILKMVEQICETDTNNISPLAHPLEVKQVLRSDESLLVENKTAIQNLSSHIEDDLYMVPKVLD